MNTKRHCTDRRPIHLRQRARRGISMLELVIAGSMLAVVMSSLSLVMRTARQSWEATDSDYAMVHQAHAVARHFVRAARESSGVASIAADQRSIVLTMADESTISWSWVAVHDGRTNVVLVTPSTTGVSTMLAHDINSLEFLGYEADGTTLANIAEDVRLLSVRVEVLLPRTANRSQVVESNVWVRSW